MTRRPALDQRRTRSGVALVLVLASLVLISGLFLAFLSSVKTDRQSSKAYTDGSGVKLLADTALNLVMAQIRAATKGKDESNNDLAWASQPGMIRTFDINGSLHEAFKLYSWSDMVDSSFDANDASEQVPNNWASQPAIFTDLNAPVGGTYPIMDPGAVGKVEGFSLTNVPGATGDQPTPMPVKWLYVLEDGQVVSPAGTGNIATVTGASAANPIVGRIAFWADDETCKVNINTASEGTFWDTPRWLTTTELALGSVQPAKREYQRYPGHPFTTSLSPILGAFCNQPSTVSLDPQYQATFPYVGTYAGNPAAPQYLQAVYNITPRVQYGGSKGATSTTANILGPVILDEERLYSSVDELIFKPVRTSFNQLEGTSSSQPITKSTLEKVKFFLTASSRAPEVNLFNKPKVAIWPIDDFSQPNPIRALQGASLSDQRSPLDKLIGFCSTIGSGANAKPFYFTRNDPSDPSADWTQRNRTLYTYLKTLMESPVPGFGRTFSSKYSTDCEQILTSIVDYIRCTNLMNGDGPNAKAPRYSDFAYSFTAAPGVSAAGSEWERDELSYAGGNLGGPSSWDTNGKGASGQVVPLHNPFNSAVKGFGNFPTVGQVGVMFIATHISPKDKNGDDNYKYGANGWEPQPGQEPYNPACPRPADMPDLYYKMGTNPTGDFATPPVSPSRDELSPFDSSLPDGAVRMQAILLIEPYIVSPSFPGAMPDYRIRIEGLNGLTVDGTGMNFPNDATVIIAGRPTLGANVSTPTAAVIPFASLLAGRTLSTQQGTSYYPFFAGATGNLPVAVDETFQFGGTFINIIISTNTGKEVQRLRIEIPGGTFPRPQLPEQAPAIDTWFTGVKKTTILSGYSVRHFGAERNTASPASVMIATGQYGRFFNSGTGVDQGVSWLGRTSDSTLFIMPVVLNPYDSQGRYRQSADTVRSVEVKSGDVRLVAGRRNIPETLFAPHVGYGSTDEKERARHSFRMSGYGLPLCGTQPGTLVTSKPGGKTYHQSVLTSSPCYFPYVGSRCDPAGGVVPENWNEGGDWDSGISRLPDGPYINRPDEGTKFMQGSRVPYFSYINENSYTSAGANLSSPNRTMPSAVMFGSLPTGVMSGRPFQTLLFCPNPRAGANHRALSSGPRDHLLLDLFQMPVVEPYAISEPFSTAGKVNMNYQIMPFSYIKRDSGLRAVFKAVKIAAVPADHIDAYKGKENRDDDSLKSPVTNSTNYRYNINATETLKAFETRFQNSEIFKSASEICDIFLYPDSQTSPGTALVNYTPGDGNIANWWKDYELTGDNMRERPYALIYPRLTTKSNTFTVHMRVQKLQKNAKDPNQNQWVEGRDIVTAEYRGASTIERYIDPNDPSMPDFAASGVTETLDDFYKFRVVNMKQFNR